MIRLSAKVLRCKESDLCSSSTYATAGIDCNRFFGERKNHFDEAATLLNRCACDWRMLLACFKVFFGSWASF